MQNNVLRCATVLALSGALCSLGQITSVASPPDPQMSAVLHQLAAFHAPPIESLTPVLARRQPLPSDAVLALLKKDGMSTAPQAVAKIDDRTIPGPMGRIPVRVYTPDGPGPFPVLVYFHGGGFVIAGINAYDASCRALCNDAQCVVVSVGYPLAPEYKLPAAQEVGFAATEYVIDNAGEFGGDPAEVAVGGESAGGEIATAVCLMARDRSAKMPVYQLLIYPVVDNDMTTPSYIEYANAHPLDEAMMKWFFHYASPQPAGPPNLYVLPLKDDDLSLLPPATIIGAEIDPLQTEGKEYAERLRAAGVPVRYRLYPGVTHEFFGMGAVVDQAKAAEKYAAAGLDKAFNGKELETTATTM